MVAANLCVCVFACIRDLARGRSPIQGVITDIYNEIQNLENNMLWVFDPLGVFFFFE